MRYLYDYGLPFSERIGVNLDDCISRVKSRKASLLIVDGMIGEGKTTMAVHLADYINKKAGFPPIDFQEQVALGGESFAEKLRICYNKKLPALIYDESGDFHRRGALTRFNQNLNRTFEMFRAFRVIVILCLPLFAVLDQEIFNKGIPQILIHLKNRNENQGDISGYSLYRMFYLRAKMDKLIVKPFAYQLVEPNLYGQFLNLPPERAELLDKYSTEGKLDFLKSSEVSLQGLISLKGISRKMGRSPEYVRKLMLKAKIKPVKKISNANYYTEDQGNMILEFKTYTAQKR